MPIIKSAIKRMRQTAKRHARNLTSRRSLRSAIKAFTSSKENTSLNAAQSALDKAVKKNLISKNAAARKKAQLAKAAKASSTKVVTAKKVTAAAEKKAPAKKPAAKKPAPKATKKA